MFKRFAIAAIALCLAIVCVSTLSPVFSYSKSAKATLDVKPVAADSSETNGESVKAVRFANILNQNFVYGTDFDDIKTIVNNSLSALLDRVDGDGYINVSYVDGYLKNMYNLSVDNLDEINSEFGFKEGYIFVIPRGYSKYNHEILNITVNEDGSVSVLSSVCISSHDGENESAKALTVFAENADSVFGYSIVSSEFVDGLSNI